MVYTTPKKIWDALGAFIEIKEEDLGTGDSSTKTFDISHNYLISGSEAIYSDGTQLTASTASSGYSVNYDNGKITFVTAPTSGTLLKVDYNYSDISNTQILTFITQSDAYIDAKTKRTFGTTSSAIEYFSIEPAQTIIFTKNWPIVTCSEVAENISDVTSTPSWTVRTEGIGNDFICNSEDREIGRIRFIDNKPTTGTDNIRVTYTHGYGSTPALVEELSTLLTIKKLVDSRIYKTITNGQDAFSPIRLELVEKRITEIINLLKKTYFELI